MCIMCVCVCVCVSMLYGLQQQCIFVIWSTTTMHLQVHSGHWKFNRPAG